VRFSANAGTYQGSDIEDPKAAGTPLDIDKPAAETSMPEAMAALLRPHLNSVPGDAKGVIAGLPLVELPLFRTGMFWRSFSRATAVGVISTKPSRRNSAPMACR
jgi:hypothetical protein